MIELNHIINQMDLVTYCTVYLNRKEYTFFSMAHGTSCKVGHILGHKANHKTGKKIKITPRFLSDHGLKLDINKSRNNRKCANSQKLNSLLEKQTNKKPMDPDRKQREIKNLSELNEHESTTSAKLCETKKAALRRVHSPSASISPPNKQNGKIS